MGPKAQPETLASYLEGGARHLRRARAQYPDINDLAEALVVSFERDEDVLVTNSIGVYRGQTKAMLRSLVPADPVRLEALIARVEAALQRRRGRPEEPRTASRKRKQVPQDEVVRLLASLARKVWANPADRASAMLALTIFVHSRIGHRPIEGQSARLQGSWLILRNAKLNANRAGAEERQIDLSAMNPLVRRAIEGFINLRSEMMARYDDYDGWYRAAAERLGRLCVEIGIERVAITSLRHVALATWKRAGLAPWVIAALAGHASDRTANRYYASGRSGWVLDGLPKADVNRVLLLEMRERFRAERRSAEQTATTVQKIPAAHDVAEGTPSVSSEVYVNKQGNKIWTEYVLMTGKRTERMLAGLRLKDSRESLLPSVAPERGFDSISEASNMLPSEEDGKQLETLVAAVS